MKRCPAVLVGFCLILTTVPLGCGKARPEIAPAEAPVIPISKPAVREVLDYVDFTGRTDAVDAVDVRARVTGYLVKIPFKEGSVVKTGDLLFEIDPRPYQAQLDNALSQINLYEAAFKLAQANQARDLDLANRVAGAVTQQQIDQDVASVAEAKARVESYKAAAEVAKLNLTFTKVISPIAGKTSRYYLTVGNLVNQDQTLLTTIVSQDPMWVYFDMDEGTLLRLRRGVIEGTSNKLTQGEFPVDIGLQGEENYPHKGSVNFVNNQVNPNTGSISVRVQVPNPEETNGIRMFSPGMFVRVHLPIGKKHKAVLVIDRAIGSDQGLKYVYVLGADNKIQSKRVTTGSLQPDGLRVISQGLEPTDSVVVGGLLQVRPGMVIQPERLPRMPTLNDPSGGLNAPGEPAVKTPAAPTNKAKS
jgi:RND family efflux transporter MFP subunit